MTNTLYENIQVLGNRMVTNLEAMGVSAAFSDGGLTLADKILQIQHFNDGVVIYSDKILAQSGDTVNLYALVLNQGIPVSGATVKFNTNIALSTKSATTSDRSIGDDYYVVSTKTGSDWDYIGTGSTGFIQFNSEKFIVYDGSWSSEISYVGKLHIENGVLTYVNTSNETVTFDVSRIDTTKLYTGAFTVYYNWVESTTSSNGVATYAYTCSGVGKLEVVAKSGNLVSSSYEITDCIMIDPAVYNKSVLLTKWFNYQSRIAGSVPQDGSGTLLTGGSNAGYLMLAPNGNSSSTTSDYNLFDKFCIEFEVVSIEVPSDKHINVYLYDTEDKSVRLDTTIMGSATSGTVKLWYDGTDVSFQLDGGTVRHPANPIQLSTLSRVGFIICNSADCKLKFKNFRVYPI